MNEKVDYREVFFSGGIVATWYEDGLFRYEYLASTSKNEDKYHRKKNKWTDKMIHCLC